MLRNHSEDIVLTLLEKKRKLKLDTVKATRRPRWVIYLWPSHFLLLFASPLFHFFISLNQYQWYPL